MSYFVIKIARAALLSGTARIATSGMLKALAASLELESDHATPCSSNYRHLLLQSYNKS